MAITRAQQYRQMLKDGNVAVQGGVKNYLGKQKTVSDVPVKWQSNPDAPSTELAYITKAEKDLILKKDIHGSLSKGPNMGPSGIMSLDSFGDIGGAGAADEEATHMGISFAVNDDLTVSYAVQDVDITGKSADEKNSGFGVSYTMGSMSINAQRTETTNVGYSTVGGDLTKTEVALGLAF